MAAIGGARVDRTTCNAGKSASNLGNQLRAILRHSDRSGHRRDLRQRFIDVARHVELEHGYLQPRSSATAVRVVYAPAMTRSGASGTTSSASPRLTGTLCASAATFDNAGSRASHVTDLTVPGAASRNTSSSAHRFSETMRCGAASAGADNARQQARPRRCHAVLSPPRKARLHASVKRTPARPIRKHFFVILIEQIFDTRRQTHVACEVVLAGEPHQCVIAQRHTRRREALESRDLPDDRCNRPRV